MQRDIARVIQDCRDGREDDPEGEADSGGEGIVGAAEAVGEGASTIGTIGAEVAAESAELAEVVPLLLL